MSSAYCVVTVDSEIATRSSQTKGKSIHLSFEIRFWKKYKKQCFIWCGEAFEQSSSGIVTLYCPLAGVARGGLRKWASGNKMQMRNAHPAALLTHHGLDLILSECSLRLRHTHSTQNNRRGQDKYIGEKNSKPEHTKYWLEVVLECHDLYLIDFSISNGVRGTRTVRKTIGGVKTITSVKNK